MNLYLATSKSCLVNVDRKIMANRYDPMLGAIIQMLENLNSYNRVRVVMGNSTCDLDSAVCALVYAYDQYSDAKAKNQDIAVMPLMNIPEKEFRLKTEVIYYLKRHNVSLTSLIFKDQLDLEKLHAERKLELILVDHHTLDLAHLPLIDSVTEIIDHRPQDPSWLWPEKNSTLTTVGSCATLVAKKLVDKNSKILDSQICYLLRGPILLDTSNFSKAANRATPSDVEILNNLEVIGSITSDRNEDFNDLLSAKTDISTLSPSDLLIRDLKVIEDIPISGLPLLVQDFIKMDGVFEALESFTKTYKSAVTIVMGLDLKKNVVTRDIAVFSLNSNQLSNKVVEVLNASTNPSLDLTQVLQSSKENSSFTSFKQGNLQASRKQVVPIIQNIYV